MPTDPLREFNPESVAAAVGKDSSPGIGAQRHLMLDGAVLNQQAIVWLPPQITLRNNRRFAAAMRSFIDSENDWARFRWRQEMAEFLGYMSLLTE